MTYEQLKDLFQKRDSSFWKEIQISIRRAKDFEELLYLSRLKKKAASQLPHSTSTKLKIAILGGYSFQNFSDALQTLLFSQNIEATFFCGDFNNEVAEILENESALREFKPDVVLFFPSDKYIAEDIFDNSLELFQQKVREVSERLLELCNKLHHDYNCEVILGNFRQSPYHDLGSWRNKSRSSEWNLKKAINTELGVQSPSHIQICDLEFLSSRLGTMSSTDAKAYLESKQIGSSTFQFETLREIIHLVLRLKKSPKKVLVLDLDNTLWGGEVGEQGMEGIDLGDTSARGEAYKSFQKYILSLNQMGVLLAVCSKNDHENAEAPFLKHPEMVLKRKHISSFKANWKPKSENIQEIARELNLGLDSFVFIDDNPAEIEIVRQFIPEVECILLDPDPGNMVGQLKDCRFFEPKQLTSEDRVRSEQYQQEQERNLLKTSITDMDTYLESLQMVGNFIEFQPVNIPRISQLINKSNQFNLTTKRRTEAEILNLSNDKSYVTFSARLSDKFGDYGLIGIFIGFIDQNILHIDTLVMSCRVLKRNVEDAMMNEIFRIATLNKCSTVQGAYIPTPKNSMVKDLLDEFNFSRIDENAERTLYKMNVSDYQERKHKIKLENRPYETK